MSNGEWHCPNCNVYISAESVTYDERHCVCGSDVDWHEDDVETESLRFAKKLLAIPDADPLDPLRNMRLNLASALSAVCNGSVWLTEGEIKQWVSDMDTYINLAAGPHREQVTGGQQPETRHGCGPGEALPAGTATEGAALPRKTKAELIQEFSYLTFTHEQFTSFAQIQQHHQRLADLAGQIAGRE